MEDIKNTI